MNSAQRVSAALAAAALTVGALAGCNPGTIVDAGDETSTPTPSVTATPTPTPTPEPAPVAVFVAPADCHQMVGAALEAQFAADGITLFNSSNGEGQFTSSGAPTGVQTGSPFICVWGVPYVDLNSFTIEAQALTQANHEGLVSVLDGSGLVKSVDGDVVTYTNVGDEHGDQVNTSVIHVLRPDSWITVSANFGGQKRLDSLTAYAAAVGVQLYPAP